jgi:ribosome-associated toxin RatA of RatAB toxin-antitoxin module
LNPANFYGCTTKIPAGLSAMRVLSSPFGHIQNVGRVRRLHVEHADVDFNLDFDFDVEFNVETWHTASLQVRRWDSTQPQ